MSTNEKLPEGWAWAKIGDIADVIGGSTPSRSEQRYFGGDIIWLTPTEIPKETVSFIFDSKEKLTEEGLEESGVRWIPANSVLLTSRASIGYVAIAGTRLTTNQGFASFVLPEGVHPLYFGWWLKSQKSTLETLAGGTTFKEISKTALKEILLPLAPSFEQTRIVAAIEQQFTRLDSAVTSLKSAQAKTKQFRASLLKSATEGELSKAWRGTNSPSETGAQLLKRVLDERRTRWEEEQLAKMRESGKVPWNDEWKKAYKEPQKPDVGHLPDLPDGWCWATVEQLAHIQGGIQKQPGRAPRQNAYPYLRVANVLRSKLDLTVIEKMELFGNELETLRLKRGDLLIVEGNGSRREIGRSALWNGEIEDCVHQNHIIRVRLNRISAEYVDFYWNSSEGKQRVMDVAASTTGLYTLSVSKIARLPIPLPPLAEQTKIVAEVEAQLSEIAKVEETIEHSLRRAEQERQSILREAFAGRLVPREPVDEQASVLLERIHEERKRRGEIEQRRRRQQQMAVAQQRRNRKNKVTLYDVLAEAGGQLAPEELYQRSEELRKTMPEEERSEGFYIALDAEVAASLIREDRPTLDKVLLHALELDEKDLEGKEEEVVLSQSEIRPIREPNSRPNPQTHQSQEEISKPTLWDE